MGERWTNEVGNSKDPIRVWTAAEESERNRIISALAEALALPIRQINYGRVAHLLGISHTALAVKVMHYGIPCPSLARVLTAGERERLVQIKSDHAQRPTDLARAVTGFIREVWG